jgi:hypothetical protein
LISNFVPLTAIPQFVFHDTIPQNHLHTVQTFLDASGASFSQFTSIKEIANYWVVIRKLMRDFFDNTSDSSSQDLSNISDKAIEASCGYQILAIISHSVFAGLLPIKSCPVSLNSNASAEEIAVTNWVYMIQKDLFNLYTEVLYQNHQDLFHFAAEQGAGYLFENLAVSLNGPLQPILIAGKYSLEKIIKGRQDLARRYPQRFANIPIWPTMTPLD